MDIRIIGYRSLTKSELQEKSDRFAGNLVPRRTVLKGLTAAPFAAATGWMSRPAAAENRLLAYVNFASALIEFAQSAYTLYSKVYTHPEVINPTNDVENNTLLGSVRNERGLVIHQGYTVIFVPPRAAATVQVIVDAGGTYGLRRLIIQRELIKQLATSG
jgi:hypothetical protein